MAKIIFLGVAVSFVTNDENYGEDDSSFFTIPKSLFFHNAMKMFFLYKCMKPAEFFIFDTGIH